MGRSVSVWLALISIVLLGVFLSGCGSSSPHQPFPTPAVIAILPATTVSLDLGTTQSFTASTMFNGQIVMEPVSYHSSNTSVVTVADNGVACAGSWDSLTIPQVCTPGSAGVAQITATAMGATSNTVTIYVHQTIDTITISAIPPPPTTACLSKDATANYQAKAFSRGVDITSTVGQFTWQTQNGTVVGTSNTVSTLGNRVNGISLDQVQLTAKAPGLTQIFASVANVVSVPFNFYTCPVVSIALSIEGVSGNSFTVAGSGTKNVIPTVKDANNNIITGVPLTWSSSAPNAGTAAPVTSTTATEPPGSGTVVLSKPGTTTIVASCTPPSCNAGLTLSDPVFPTGVIYPETVINATATVNSSSEQSQTVWATSTSCNAPGNAGTNCVTALGPINSPTNVVGSPVLLPATPNSFRLGAFHMGSSGTLMGYLGTDASLQGTRGLMIANLSAATPSVSQLTSVVGKVLAVSPDGSKAIVSDTLDAPNVVYVVTHTTTSTTAISLPITGAVAADFSPDSLKAFILANQGTSSTLYVYSQVDALQTVPLSSTNIANDVSFLSEGAFAYIAGGSPSGVTIGRTCDNAIVGNVSTTAAPTLIKSLPNATQVLALVPPLLDVINVNPANLMPPPITGCMPTVVNSTQTFNLGQGVFSPKQLLIAPDSSKAYIIASNLPSILVFDLNNQISSSLPLNGTTTPLAAALTLDGNLLYVASSDGLVHVLSTLSGGDIFDISFPSTPTTPDYLCPNSPPVACLPDLIAIQP